MPIRELIDLHNPHERAVRQTRCSPDGHYRIAIERTIDMGIDVALVLEADGSGQPVEVQNQDNVRALVVLVESVGHGEKVDFTDGQMDESIRVVGLWKIRLSLRLALPHLGRSQVKRFSTGFRAGPLVAQPDPPRSAWALPAGGSIACPSSVSLPAGSVAIGAIGLPGMGVGEWWVTWVPSGTPPIPPDAIGAGTSDG